MRYRFRPLPELYWGVLTAIALAVLPTLLTFDPSAITDWQTWALALIGAIIRPAVGALLDYIRRSMAGSGEPTLDEKIDAMSPEDIAAVQLAIDRWSARERAEERQGMRS